ncbi:MAG: YkgJ family cysteine cluster protein [Bdellovibrionales bacterium]|nr:YkgJ family cysteine cluster protein [Bdellovibrionales bacterium]
MAKAKWYKDGLKFECQGSGNCCVSRGQYGFVYLTKEDRKRLAKGLGIATSTFTRQYCKKSDGFFFLKENQDKPECQFLEENKCRVYSSRPTQCRTWPFWPENLNPRAWKSEILDFCPGANKGRLFTAPEIDKLKNDQLVSEKIMANERTSS